MKAVILCAGVGTRLEPLTFARPKHLLPVAGRAVLDHVLDSLADAGVDQGVFVVGRQADHLREFIGDGSRWEMTAEYVVQDEPRGLADAVRCARAAVEGERFIVYLGDDLLGEGISDFVASFQASQGQAALVVKRVEDPRQFGVVVVEDGRVVKLVEKPREPPSDLAIVGVYAFRPEIFEAIESIQPSDRGELEITDAIDCLLAHGGQVDHHETEGFWEDVGSPESLLSANAFYLSRIEPRVDGEVDGASRVEGLVQIGAGARVTGSRVTGPCLIGADCVVADSELGPDVSLADDCEVMGSRIVNSILDEGCQVQGVQGGLLRSLLGRGVRVQGVQAVEPTAHLSVVAADNTMIAEADHA